MPDGYIWCEHCGYNRSLTTDQLNELTDDVVETWCLECDEAMLNHGSECPDHIHLDLPLLPYRDAEPLCQYCKGTGWLVLPAMKGAVPCDHGKDARSWICADAGTPALWSHCQPSGFSGSVCPASPSVESLRCLHSPLLSQ